MIIIRDEDFQKLKNDQNITLIRTGPSAVVYGGGGGGALQAFGSN